MLLLLWLVDFLCLVLVWLVTFGALDPSTAGMELGLDGTEPTVDCAKTVAGMAHSSIALRAETGTRIGVFLGLTMVWEPHG